MNLIFGILLFTVFAQEDHEVQERNPNEVDERKKKGSKKACKGTTEPTSCEECEANKKCIKKGGFKAICSGFGWTGQTCETLECAEVTADSCANCQTLGNPCIQSLSAMDTCRSLGYNPKTGDCSNCDTSLAMDTCADCITLGKDCIRTLGHGKNCKTLGFKKGACSACSDDVPVTCADCDTLGKKCVKQKRHVTTCRDLGWSKKGCEEEGA